VKEMKEKHKLIMKKPRKELIADIKLIGFKIKPYKLWFMSRKELERLFNYWLTIWRDLIEDKDDPMHFENDIKPQIEELKKKLGVEFKEIKE
jgi:hypothetical protein